MLNVEQFIYTTASLKGKSGYQVAAKSSGITDDIIIELDQYLYPIGIDLSEFKESHSLVLLQDGKVAYSKIKNIGRGYDGRDNTLHTHTFVFEKNDFDTRVLNDFCTKGDESVRGHLPMLKLDPPILSMDFKNLRSIKPILYDFFLAIFNNHKIVIVDNNMELIPILLSFLPKSMRLMPFSTLLIYPQKQPAYTIALTHQNYVSNFEKEFTVVNSKEYVRQQPHTLLEQCVSFLIDLINEEKINEINEIFYSFEKIVHPNYKNKIMLSTIYFRYQSEIDNALKQKYAEEMIQLLNKFDNIVASKYLEKIKGSLREYTVLQDRLKPVIDPYTSLIDAFFLLPAKVMNDLYASYIERQKKMRRYDDD